MKKISFLYIKNMRRHTVLIIILLLHTCLFLGIIVTRECQEGNLIALSVCLVWFARITAKRREILTR